MVDCYQFEGVNMLEHGQMVHLYYLDLLKVLSNEECIYKWDIPENTLLLLKEVRESVNLPIKMIKDYHVYHDCGKYKSLYYDEDGKKHFPDHAKNSAETWKHNKGNSIVEHLILNDMYFHITKPNNVEKFDFWEILLLTAWSEIHANAIMFGGVESTSFKIKKKHLIKITNRLK